MNPRVVVLMIGGMVCAHAGRGPSAQLKCENREVALQVARGAAEQTQQSDGVTLRPDAGRIVDQPDKWKVWTIVGKGGVPGDAYLIVRKSDCATDWETIMYKM